MIYISNEGEVHEVKTDKKPYKNILIQYIGCATAKSVTSLYLVINIINGYVEESNGNQYLTLVSTVERHTEKLRKTIEQNQRSD